MTYDYDFSAAKISIYFQMTFIMSRIFCKSTSFFQIRPLQYPKSFDSLYS